MKEIYQQTVEEVFERVKGNISGLTSEQVKSSREKCGWNELAEGKKKRQRAAKRKAKQKCFP